MCLTRKPHPSESPREMGIREAIPHVRESAHNLMKRILLVAATVALASAAFGQGTVQFNNRIFGSLITYVYFNSAVPSHIIGNGTAETPTGTTDWSGFSKVSGSGWMAA